MSACPYAPPGRDRCAPAICDCFLDIYPDDPFGIHPEAFVVQPARVALEAALRGEGE